jgi:cell division protein FtsX
MEEVLTELLGQLTPLVIALLLAVTNSEVVDYIKRPIQQKFPKFDLWFFVYVSLATGFVIGWFAEINLFVPFVKEEILGRVLTAILIGGGSSLIYRVFKKPNGG